MLLAIIIFSGLYCKKEASCENCIDGNKPPIANAGANQLLTLPTDSVLLDGSSSRDPDGNISFHLWKKISGPATYLILNPSESKTIVRELAMGTYQFELKVTDNGNLSATDTIQITVADPAIPNRPPVANAGADQTITLPTTIANLDASASTDPDYNITGYEWTKISGPASYSFTNANAVQTQITNLVQGAYMFELKVTDAGGLSDKDTMQVTVNEESNTSAVDIYVAGQLNSWPVYWKNGQVIQLNGSVSNYTATSIAVDSSNIYVAATRFELWWNDYAAKYWIGGQAISLGIYAGASSIVHAGNDVYVAGYEWEDDKPELVAKYWKNGQPVALTDGTIYSYANSIFVDDNDVYVAGYVDGIATYWKNGIPVSLTNGSNQAYANSIFVVGNDIYVAGSEMNGTHHVAKYWKNGQAVTLTNGNSIHAEANSIVVVGNDIYIAGWEGDFVGSIGGTGAVAKYWKNGQEVQLTSGASYAYAYSIAVFGNDIYVAGVEGSQAKYWKNGQAVTLSANGGRASSIVVVSH